MIPNRTKLFSSLSFISITLAVILHSRVKFGIPRPVWIFVFFGISIGSSLLIVYQAKSRITYYLPVVSSLLVGIYLRVSGYLIVVTSGLDYGRWLQRAQLTTEVGHVIGSDMYEASPLYILELTVSHLLIGGNILSVRFVTIIIGSGLPVLFLLFVYRLSGDLRTGVISLLLTVSYGFYLRTAALLEAESLALVWFLVSIYCFVCAVKTTDRRWVGLLTGIVASAVMLHFFYSTIIVVILFSTYILLLLINRLASEWSFEPYISLIGVGLLISLVLVPTWMLWSVYAHTAASTLSSAFGIPDFSSITQIFVPNTGASAEATGGGAGGSTSSYLTFGKFFPFFAVFGLGGLGGIYALIRDWERFLTGIILATIVGIATIGILVVQLDYNLGFRLYYFVAVFALVFAAVALSQVKNISKKYVRYLTVGSVVLLIISVTIFAPLSPLSNNVDPRYGGTSWTVTITDEQQFSEMNTWDKGNVNSKMEISQVHSFFTPSFTEQTIVSKDCGGRNKLGTTGDYDLCMSNKDLA